MRDEAHRLDDHALAAVAGQLLPPGDPGGLALRIGDVDGQPAGLGEPVRIGVDELVAELQVPGVITVDEDAGLGGEDVERSESEICDGLDRPDVAAVRVDVVIDVLDPAPMGVEQFG